MYTASLSAACALSDEERNPRGKSGKEERLFGQMQNSFQMIRLREQIHNVGLLQVVA